jgi:hypothetical protein
MSDERTPYDEDAAQTRRLAILHELAQSRIGDSLKTPAVSAPSSTSQPTDTGAFAPAAPWPERRAAGRRVRWMLPITLVALLAVGFAALYLARGATQSQAPQKTALPKDIALTDNGLTCPRGAAWSPDGKDIAVVGYKENCADNFPGSYQYHAGALQIYDATSGGLLGEYKLDDAVQPRLRLPTQPAALSPEAILYDTVSWSPNGRRVAVTFNAFHWVQNPCFNPGLTVTGVVVTDAFSSNGPNASAHAFDVFVRAPKQNDFSSPVWDLQEARQLNTAFVPALGYRWGDSGSLQPMTPLTVGARPAAPALGPIGDPHGSAPYTMWQPAEITYALHYVAPTAEDCGFQLVAAQTPPYIFQSDYSAWSPDGRYLAANAGFQALLQLDGAPAPDAKTLGDLALTQTVAAPIRDKALQQTLIQLAQTPGGGGFGNTLLARVSWRPDGKILAAYHVYTGVQVTGYDRILTLYDCATGKSLGDLPPPKHTGQGQDDYESSRLYWAPNGTRLLLMDAQTTTLRIWGADLLPK